MSRFPNRTLLPGDLSISVKRAQLRQKASMVARSSAPLILVFAVSNIAHAQASIDLSGATNVMNTFKTFALTPER